MFPRSPRGASHEPCAWAGWIPSKHKADQGGLRAFPNLETEQSSLELGIWWVHDNWLGSDSVRITGIASQDLQAPPGKASVRLAHLVPHLVVHGDALPVLKVAAVRAGRSRACPRRHRAEPRPLTSTLCLTHPAKPPANPFPAASARLPVHTVSRLFYLASSHVLGMYPVPKT